MVVYYREGGVGKSWWRGCNFFSAKRGGFVIFFGTPETMLHRNFRIPAGRSDGGVVIFRVSRKGGL